jgi:hypothetical protein
MPVSAETTSATKRRADALRQSAAEGGSPSEVLIVEQPERWGATAGSKSTKSCQEQPILHTNLLGCHRMTQASAMAYKCYLLLRSAWRKRWNSFAGRYADHAVFRRLSSVGSSAAARSRDAAEDLRERWETSDSPFVHRIQVGIHQGPPSTVTPGGLTL